MKNTIVIPSLDPTTDLIKYIDNLILETDNEIIVVNDGSCREKEYIFKELSKKERCTILCHRENYGKGAALKTAFSYIKNHRIDIDGIITVDADGQHSVKDVKRMNDALQEHPKNLVLGVREFGKNTPARSMFGNTVSAKTMKVLYGINLKDTQTGLRGISCEHLDWLLQLKGERYEYELNMIIESKKILLPIHTIKIQTLYFNNNSGSHFRPIKDGTKVYFQMLRGLFRYMGNSCISALTDILLFTILFYITGEFTTATIATAVAASISRVVSSIVDFRLNRGSFASKETTSHRTYYKYYTLWSIQLCASITFVTLVSSALGIVQTVVKPFTDLILAIISYQVQLHWVFKNEGKEKKSKQSFLVKILKYIAKKFIIKDDVSDDIFNESAVLVGHHQNLYGPIVAALYFPETTKIWILSCFFDYKSCFNQYYTYTFTKRLGMPKVVAFISAVIAALFVTYFVKAIGAIPVYRRAGKLKETFSRSIAELEKGNQVMIFPDVEYTDESLEMGRTYSGYIKIAKIFEEKNKKRLPFIPVCCNKEMQEIAFGKKYYNDPLVTRKVFADMIVRSHNDLVSKKIISAANLQLHVSGKHVC